MTIEMPPRLLVPGQLPVFAPPEPAKHYWDAGAFTETLLDEFRAARRRGDNTRARERFYVVAAYYRRTLAIAHFALEQGDEALATPALRNLRVLLGALSEMREAAPHTSLSSLALESNLHRRLNRDLVFRILAEAGGPLHVATVVHRFNELNVLGDARQPAIERALLTLVQTGHAFEREGLYRPSGLPYLDADIAGAALEVLLGPKLAQPLREHGFDGISAALDRPGLFARVVRTQTGCGQETTDLLLQCAAALAAGGEPVRRLHDWSHAPLLESGVPRRYQRSLHAILRARGYAAQVIEAPAGSGKTLVGMLCIEDWLRSLGPGQSILVLVPTVNYQQQWVGELCLKPTGLRLATDLVFAGTPRAGMGLRERHSQAPVAVLTYAALAHAGSGAGKGGFDGDAIERFLQAANVRHVILDEVHKVAADPVSPTAEITRLLVRWLHDGSLSSLIGFSGTVTACEDELRSLGLQVASVLPDAELIAQGWVAPFAEFGVPFSYSARERTILELVRDYRALVVEYLRRLGGSRLRQTFAAIPLETRVEGALSLGMYAGKSGATALARARMRAWETGGDVRLSELQLVCIVQMVHGWPDAELMGEFGLEAESWQNRFEAAHERLREALPPGVAHRRLSAGGFGVWLDLTGLQQNPTPGQVRDSLATTFVGGYLAAREWPRHAGEGRVAVVNAIMAAERRVRPLEGVIVFETPSPIRPHDGLAVPGYRGAGGLFAELLGEGSCVPIAALTSAIYLPDVDVAGEALHERAADWIRDRIGRQEQGEALFTVVAAGAGLDGEAAARFRPAFEQAFEDFVATLDGPEMPGKATAALLRSLRHALRSVEGRPPRAGATGPHARAAAAAIVDYAAIARAFREAHRVEVVQGDGTRASMRVVSVGGRRLRQRMLDLTARLVDADDLPFDVVIVSSWARTGWNVLTPNVLIDATATRDVTAWQQLRGRAMRPDRRWTQEAQARVERLLAPADPGTSPNTEMAAQVMLSQNKVTHIYELVNAKGTKSQVAFDASRSAWDRIEAISEKHRHEHSVRARDGLLMEGSAHAPVVIATDPRLDAPEALQERLEAELEGADARIVRGWLSGR